MANFAGNDNYGHPKQQYIDKIAEMDDTVLFKETKQKIWLSAYANNNPRSDFHWHVDALYEEWQRREGKDGYDRAYKEVYAELFG